MKAFVALNFLAGFLHYLFLVVASKQLPPESFSRLSAWLAYLSFAFIGAGVMQYLSCFVPLRRGQIKTLISTGLISAAGIAILPFVFPLNLMNIGGVAGLMACAFAVFLGQAQVRLLFLGLSLGNFTVAFCKLLFALLLPFESPDRYYWAVPLGFVPAFVWLSVVLMRYRDEAPKTAALGGVKAAIVSTVVLGSASALFPQFELMLMRSTQSAEVFNGFARLSLFYKAIFFIFLIFSQWLLPHQLRNPERAGKALSDPRLYAGAFFLAAAGALFGPLVAQYALGWEASPSRLQIFLSCWNMGLLTWLFLLLQDLTAKTQNRLAVFILAGAFVIAPLQLGLAFSIENYYAVAIVWNTFLIWRTVTSAGAANPKSSLPLNAA